MKYKEAEKIKVGDIVMVRNDNSTYVITGIRKCETMIMYETDGGELNHKNITDILT